VSSTEKRTLKRMWNWGKVNALAAVAGVVLAIVLAVIQYWPSLAGPVTGDTRTATHEPSLQSPPLPQASAPPPSISDQTTLTHIRFDPVGQIPRCATFTGTGDVPSGRILWLVALTASSKYYFKPVTTNAVDHKWSAANVNIGSQADPVGTPYIIYAALVDDATSRQIGQLGSGVTELPEGIDKVAQIKVSRSGDGAKC
jgi:hypothetical protein